VKELKELMLPVRQLQRTDTAELVIAKHVLPYFFIIFAAEISLHPPPSL
jgi:hypothetical protein